MTPGQSVTPKPSLFRRYVAVIGAAVLAAAWAVGISTPASAAPVKGSLDIVSITDTASGLGGPVQGRPFDVVVRVLDAAGQPTAVSHDRIEGAIMEGLLGYAHKQFDALHASPRRRDRFSCCCDEAGPQVAVEAIHVAPRSSQKRESSASRT